MQCFQRNGTSRVPAVGRLLPPTASTSFPPAARFPSACHLAYEMPWSSIDIMKSEMRKARGPEDGKVVLQKGPSGADDHNELEGYSNDYTSESPSHMKSNISSDAEEPPPKSFQAVDPYIFVKASRKFLAQHPPELSHLADSAAGLDTARLRACKSHADKQSRAFEYFLVAVTSMYYGDPYITNKGKRAEPERAATKAAWKLPRRRKDAGRESLLSALVSPLRHEYTFESWNPRELAVFEAGLCAFGKRFDKISALMNESKSIAQISALYHDWKSTSHYKYWKEAVIRENWS